MKNKLFAVLCCCVLSTILVLAGCASNSGPSDSSKSSSTTSTKEVASVEQKTVYVTADWLKSALDGNQKGYENVVVAEVSYDASKSETYAKGHIPGAIKVGDVEVEDATGDEKGAYNLLSASEIEKYALSHGITKDTKVVLYGADISGTARVAYAYLYLGVEDVKILNGGLDAWTKAGYTAETTENTGKSASSFGTTVPAHPEYWTSIADAKSKVKSDSNFKLVSIRSEAEWLGETSGYTYMDKAGEPEGAVWGKGPQSASDVADFTNSDGTVKDLDGLKTVWKDCDFTLDNHLAFYCGTGWRACVPFLVLYENGYTDISVYDGGWYEWLMHDDYPVQVGDPKSSSCEHTTVGALPTGKASAE